MKSFASEFQWDEEFHSNLKRDTSSNQAVPLILLTYEERDSAYSLDRLVKFVQGTITLEHIIPQTPNFQVTSHGFKDDEDFRAHQHMLGNLAILTRSENSRCSNKPVHTKMTDPSMYADSIFAGTQALVHQYAASGGAFNKEAVLKRMGDLASFALSRLSIW